MINLHWVLLLGVGLNWLGALVVAGSTMREIGKVSAPDDYWQLRLFFAGTAATFGALYLYLYFHPEYVWPFLIFGAALKTWAFVLSLYLSAIGRFPRSGFIQFGISNGIVAAAFWLYLWQKWNALAAST